MTRYRFTESRRCRQAPVRPTFGIAARTSSPLASMIVRTLKAYTSCHTDRWQALNRSFPQ